MWATINSALLRILHRAPADETWGEERPGAKPDEDPKDFSSVVVEAQSVLRGRSADLYASTGQPIPYWAWLNALAHREPQAYRAIATAYPWEEWTFATLMIAAQLDQVSADDARAIQAEVFVPAELHALEHPEDSPEAVLRCVRRHVAQRCRRSGAER